MEFVVLVLVSPWLVDASSVLDFSSFKFLGLRWAPAPFQHRSAWWFVLSHVGHFGYSFLVDCPSLLFTLACSLRLSFRQSSLTWPGFLQQLQVALESIPEERGLVPGRDVDGAEVMVGTGRSSFSSRPFNSCRVDMSKNV